MGVPRSFRAFPAEPVLALPAPLARAPLQLILLTFLFYTVSLLYTLGSKIIFKKVKF